MNKKTKLSKRKKGAWFIPVRGSYLPVSWQGWFSYVPYTSYIVFTSVVGWQQMNSKELAVLFIVPNWIAATIAMTYLAKQTS
jgi:hypothetical protein